jgi:hypothetical protein
MAVLRVVSLLLCAFIALPLHAQELKKWMPRVGDEFVYDHVFSYLHYGMEFEHGNGHDTVRVRIDSIVNLTVYSSGGRFDFVNHSESFSEFPFGIDYQDLVADFSKGTVRQLRIDGQQHRVISAPTALDTVYSDSYQWTASYDASIKWLAHENFSAQFEFGCNGYTSWSYDLLTSATSNSFVSSIKKNLPQCSFEYDRGSITIWPTGIVGTNLTADLLDPLGRPIRSWQMPIESGERQITLNVADVPSGVYFLRVSGGGIDEVKKVAIIH